MPSDNKNKELADDFHAYCMAHPEQRFWQALRNWSDYNFVLVADHVDLDSDDPTYKGVKNTFYWEGKSE